MIVLSDEPKALVLTAQRMMDLSPNIRKNFRSVDTLAFLLNDYIRDLRTKGGSGTYIGTGGFYVFRFEDEDEGEEIMLMLNIGAMHTYNNDPERQQFVYNDGPMEYDDSCPPEWAE